MEQAHKKVAECESFLFNFFVFWKEERTEGSRELEKLSSHEFVSDLLSKIFHLC